MGQLHLYHDADERVTMVQTYLALREGGHADESHMGIVLGRLFAPAGDSAGKDELIMTMPDAITAVLAKK
jgi:hypothetical protein